MSVALALLSGPAAASTSYDCSHIRVEGQSFDLSSLSGEYSVSHLEPHPPTTHNTTYTLNVCGPLKRKKGVPRNEQCHQSARVCAIERTIGHHKVDGEKKQETVVEVTGVIDIAGEFVHDGLELDPAFTRLKTSSSNADSEKEGLRVELHGGRYPFEKRHGRKQRAIIEFVCDQERTGLEGLVEDGETKQAGGSSALARGAPDEATADEDKDDDGEEGDGSRSPDDDDDKGKDDDRRSLRYISYGATSDDIAEDTLRLEWRTKYACEGMRDGGKEDQPRKSGSGHWGFFTWFIIVVFLATASYLIFGSWLNYNRYGARGWDLLPHGDTIRDIPYLLRDFVRRVVNTVQGTRGGGSRGGYSAV